jgi:hypothetical protein
MASSVATPLETQFGQIPGLLQMTSARALGFTQVTLQFDLSRALDGAVSDTLSAINAASAQLPPNMPSTHMRCMITANRRARATIGPRAAPAPDETPARVLRFLVLDDAKHGREHRDEAQGALRCQRSQ